ncbi:hypothetical protein BU23DRAFT_445056 [Bimuria novae-zelandiae CBS 107.79]|uniref:Rhodopsin domain-containing protein n=1 Tax=Bimuria novae-zelandiae CBS 107.79 TaxID=1447943 RepID=A0A6A5W033_9PLEO|nr:hypothetical protein BU23DRAFT_445056 [Bimuria novae-zelandiae CBS 107.79]
MSGTTVTPEYLAEDIGPSIIATASLTIAFTTVFVALRYYARHLSQTRFGVEDVIIPFAWLAEVGLCIIGIVMVKRAGTGRHVEYVLKTHPEGVISHYKGLFANQLVHPLAVALPKIVIVILFLRVFNQKWERRAAWITLWLMLGTLISYSVASMFQCRPISYNWDQSIPGKCFNFDLLANSSSVPNILTDLIVLVLPIRTVIGLKVSTSRKIGLMLIFLTGSVGIVASVIRTIVFVCTDPLLDITFNYVALVNWTIIEPGMYLLAACALSFKPLWRMLSKFIGLYALCTHTKSSATITTLPMPAQESIHLETLKTASSGGFTKLSSGRDTIDEELEVETAAVKPPGPGITVMRTVETMEEFPYATRASNVAVADPTESPRAVGRAI